MVCGCDYARAKGFPRALQKTITHFPCGLFQRLSVFLCIGRHISSLRRKRNIQSFTECAAPSLIARSCFCADAVVEVRGEQSANLALVLQCVQREQERGGVCSAGECHKHLVRRAASAGGELVFSDQPPLTYIHRIDLQNEI